MTSFQPVVTTDMKTTQLFLTTLVLGQAAIAAATLGACSDDKSKEPADGALGAACEPSKDQCQDALVCALIAEGESACTVADGDVCEPKRDDVDNGGCRLNALCLPGEDAEEPATCRIAEGGECEPEFSYCRDELRCSEVVDGSHRCFMPVLLVGAVSDSRSGAAVEGAHIIGIDDEGSAVTSVAVSDVDGHYELDVPVLREEDGDPKNAAFTLRAAAQDYQPFPEGVRVALPIEVGKAKASDGAYRVDTALTQVALIPLPEGERFLVAGRLLARDDAGTSGDLTGVLVVAADGTRALSATTDRDGTFTIFNVPKGDYEVRGYAADVQLSSTSVKVNAAVDDVTLHELGSETSTLRGNIQLVNAPGGALTTVMLVVEDTFDAAAGRGEVPRGLRAPRSGQPSVDGDFEISGVPEGRYVVLAAYENDDLVRDPDVNIAGTGFVKVAAPAKGTTIELNDSFKVTEALRTIGPGSDSPEAVSEAPMLSWADDSSEDWYEVRVFDAFGDEVWSFEQPGVSGQDVVSVMYEGPLDAGMYYQFRVTSWRQPGKGDPAPIAATEDLRGVFFAPPK